MPGLAPVALEAPVDTGKPALDPHDRFAWKFAYRFANVLINRVHFLPFILVLMFLAGLVSDPGILLVVIVGGGALWIALRWHRIRAPLVAICLMAERFRFMPRMTRIIRQIATILAVIVTMASLVVASGFLFSPICVTVMFAISLVLWIIFVAARSWRHHRIVATTTVLLTWAASFAFLVSRFTLLYAPVADAILVAIIASLAPVIAVSTHMLIRQRPLDSLITNPWGAWATSTYLILFTQAFAFGLTYDTSHTREILDQQGVTAIATYEQPTDFRRQTGLVINLAAETCRKDRYLVGYFMTTGGLPAIAFDAPTGEVTPLAIVGDSSENFINLCDDHEYLVGSGNRLVLLEERGQDFVMRDDLAFPGSRDYVRRIMTDPITHRNWVSVWHPESETGTVHEVKVGNGRISLGETLNAELIIPFGDTTFALQGGMLQKIQDGHVVAQIVRGDSPKFTGITFSPRHNLLYLINGVLGFFSGTMEIIDGDTLKRIKTVDLKKLSLIHI